MQVPHKFCLLILYLGQFIRTYTYKYVILDRINKSFIDKKNVIFQINSLNFRIWKKLRQICCVSLEDNAFPELPHDIGVRVGNGRKGKGMLRLILTLIWEKEVFFKL